MLNIYNLRVALEDFVGGDKPRFVLLSFIFEVGNQKFQVRTISRTLLVDVFELLCPCVFLLVEGLVKRRDGTSEVCREMILQVLLFGIEVLLYLSYQSIGFTKYSINI